MGPEIKIRFNAIGKNCYICDVTKPKVVDIPVGNNEDDQPLYICICSDCIKNWNEQFENEPGKNSWMDLF